MKIQYGFLAFIVAGLTSSLASAQSTNVRKFKCAPARWYSGGFDLYEVEITLNEDGTQIFSGERFFQSTTGHGVRIGVPVSTGTFDLTSQHSSSHVILSGFSSQWGETDVLSLPQQWNGEKVVVESELFLNDIRETIGHCVK